MRQSRDVPRRPGPQTKPWARVGDRNYLLKQMDAKFKAIDSNAPGS